MTRSFDTRHVYPPALFQGASFREDTGGLTDKERRETVRDQSPENFTFIDAKSALQITFDVLKLRNAIGMNVVPFTVGEVAITMDLYLSLLQRNLLEPEHLPRINVKRLAVPLIFLYWDKSWVLVDGVHRLVKRFRTSLPYARAVVVTEPYHQRFVMDAIKTDLHEPNSRTRAAFESRGYAI